MFKVIWNIVKYFLAIFQRMVYPAKRLICRRRKLSASDAAELTSIGTGDGHQMNSVSGSLPKSAADVEMEPWDSWGGMGGQAQVEHNNLYGTPPPAGRENAYNYQEKPSVNGQAVRKGNSQGLYQHTHQRKPEPEPEVDINFFEDMTPAVQKQKKFLIRKKEMAAQSFGLSSRLAVTSDVPLETSELESWEDTGKSWEDSAEPAEDITWQAEEAIREKKKKDRMDRQAEQQKKKQRKDEMRGFKGGSLAATKLS